RRLVPAGAAWFAAAKRGEPMIRLLSAEEVSETDQAAHLVHANVRQHNAAVGKVIEVPFGRQRYATGEKIVEADACLENEFEAGTEGAAAVQVSIGVHPTAAHLEIRNQAARFDCGVVVAQQQRGPDNNAGRAVDDGQGVQLDDAFPASVEDA